MSNHFCRAFSDVPRDEQKEKNTDSDFRANGRAVYSDYTAQQSMYGNKEEYLAGSDLKREMYGRVFDCICPCSAEYFSATENCDGTCDASAVFGLIENFICNSESFPCTVSFENNIREKQIACPSGPVKFAGVILCALTLAVRLSADMSCVLTLSGDDDYTAIEAQCVLHKSYGICGRGDGFEELLEALPSNLPELMTFERFVSSYEWSVEYFSVGDGTAHIRVILDCDVDADRLKFRDASHDILNILCDYEDYAVRAFSPDPE